MSILMKRILIGSAACCTLAFSGSGVSAQTKISPAEFINIDRAKKVGETFIITNCDVKDISSASAVCLVPETNKVIRLNFDTIGYDGITEFKYLVDKCLKGKSQPQCRLDISVEIYQSGALQKARVMR